MKKAIDKFLMSDKVLYSMPWIYSIVFVISYGIQFFVTPEIFSVFYFCLELMNIFLIFGITISYKAHEKNIMKTLFGALMMESIIWWLHWLTSAFEEEYENVFVDRVFSAIILCLYVIFFINHLVLGYGHKSNPARIELNRVVVLLIIIVTIIWSIMPLDSIIFLILEIIYDAAILIEVLCIETKVDAYKIIRENNAK